MKNPVRSTLRIYGPCVVSPHFSLGTVLPPLPVVVPLLAAAVLAALRQKLARAAADSIGILAASINLLVCLLLLRLSLHATIVAWFGGWYPRGHQVIGIGFVADPAAAGLATLAAFLTLLSLVFSWRFVDAGANHFQPLMMVFLAAMSGFALTGDLFNMFVFFELMSTAAFALCGLKSQESAPIQGAFNFAVTNTIAAFFVLTGIALLYAITGALNLAQIGATLGTRHDPLVLFAATLLFCGFLVKAAIVPFHFWLPDAHSVAPTPVCVLFSGLMVELGLYAVLRLHAVAFSQTFAAYPGRLSALLLSLAVTTVLLGGVMCYAEHHLKRLLAFSTISHAGLMLSALALNTPLATGAMLLYLLAHALIKSSLFFSSGILLHRLRTVSEPRLFGRGRPLRWTAVLWFAGAAGLAGAPPFLTFLGVAMATHAAGPLRWIPYLFMAGGALTSAAVLRAGMHIFFGWGSAPITDRSAQVDELPETRAEESRIFPYHFLPPLLCLLVAVTLPFVPGLRPFILLAADRVSDGPAYIHTLYTGVSIPVAAQAPFRIASLIRPAMEGLLALTLGLLLALSSVFRLRFPRSLRVGAFLEGPMAPLRALQSGHPGDYVMWLTVGVAVIGLAMMTGLR